jgi:hypothetical protein
MCHAGSGSGIQAAKVRRKAGFLFDQAQYSEPLRVVSLSNRKESPE